jgi:hypothetical protein
MGKWQPSKSTHSTIGFYNYADQFVGQDFNADGKKRVVEAVRSAEDFPYRVSRRYLLSFTETAARHRSTAWSL